MPGTMESRTEKRMATQQQRMWPKIPHRKKPKQHQYYHFHLQINQETRITGNKNTTQPDRRKRLQEGIPRENRHLFKNNITFDTQTQKWQCQRCRKTYDNQSQRNATQHACKHINENIQANDPKWTPWNTQETILRDCRIRTLKQTNYKYRPNRCNP